MTDPPRTVAKAAAAFGLDPARLRSLGGASGSSWEAGPHVLRVGPRAVLDWELLAATTAAAVVPVPGLAHVQQALTEAERPPGNRS